MPRDLKRWWWLAPIALAGLLILSWRLGDWLEAAARERAADAAGIPVDRVEMVDGLNVHLTGFETAHERDRAIAAVQILDSSWRVTGDLVEQLAGPDAVSAEIEGFVRDTPVGRPPDVIFTFTGGRLALEGTVGTQVLRDALRAAADQLVGPELVDDHLTVDSDDMAGEGGSITVTGDGVPAEQHQAWLPQLQALTDDTGMELVDQLGVGSVEADLNDLFDQQPIEFQPRSSQLTEGSTATLDAAADLLAANPATRFRVVGHTDSDGEADRNQQLSQERAEAVVAYLVGLKGIDPARLEAEGRGEAELEVEPEMTPEDKQRNRRIEWEQIG